MRFYAVESYGYPCMQLLIKILPFGNDVLFPFKELPQYYYKKPFSFTL